MGFVWTGWVCRFGLVWIFFFFSWLGLVQVWIGLGSIGSANGWG